MPCILMHIFYRMWIRIEWTQVLRVRSQAGQEIFTSILTRRVGETVMIGNDVTVTMLGVKGNQVLVFVNAPPRPGRPPRRDLRAN